MTAILHPHPETRSARRWPFLAVTGALFVLLMSANLPAGRYILYRQRFGFASVTLTAVFATYAVVLIPSLILFGQLSDRIGRRRVLLLGLAVSVLALVVFALARGTGWLFVARALQGVAFFGAQTRINQVAPADRRGEVTAAFITCVYAGVATASITVGLLSERVSLAVAVGIVSVIVGTAALATAVVHITVWRRVTCAWPSPERPDGSAAGPLPYSRRPGTTRCR